LKKRTQGKNTSENPGYQVMEKNKVGIIVRIKVLGYVKMKATGKGRNSRSQGNVIGRTKRNSSVSQEKCKDQLENK